MKHIRRASQIAVLIGVGLLIASIGEITGTIGAAVLIAVGTVGCIESELRREERRGR